jgi:hypothetical protein
MTPTLGIFPGEIFAAVAALCAKRLVVAKMSAAQKAETKTDLLFRIALRLSLLTPE